MTVIFLDTCIWVNYIWQKIFSENIKKKTASTKLIERLKGDKKYEIILSPFLISEISSHFKDFFILQKVIRDGFSYRDLNKEKKNYKLTKAELEKINEIIIEIGAIDNVNTLSPSDLKKDAIEKILNLETKYYFDFYDALHIHTAIENKCKYFITADSPLRKCASDLNKDGYCKLECLPAKSFLKIIN